MTSVQPDKIWWTAGDIADAALPDLPRSRQRVEAMAKREDWRTQDGFCRKRAGRGGGYEYHWKLLPVAARRKLLSQVVGASLTPATSNATQFEFDALTEKAKVEARRKHQIVMKFEALENTGLAKAVAVTQTALLEGVAERTLWSWLRRLDGVDRSQWLFALAGRHKTAKRAKRAKANAPEFMERLKSLFLRLEQPTFTQCYRDAVQLAEANGWETLPERTARRQLDRNVPRVVQVLAREGATGLARCFPPQIRDHTTLHAMEGVNADCHRFDVFVRWPGAARPERPQIVAFQDIYSGKVLSWRIDHTPNEVAVMSAFGEMVENFGIPVHCTFDNGREFASKWLSGGSKTRYRGKIKDDDPIGVLPLLGIQIHWAMPGHGQAKPVERTFRDFASDIAKDVRFEGAYVGNRPDAKPENYGNAAVDLEYFVNVVSERIAQHNARIGRKSLAANGGSFDEAFAKSFASAPIRMPSEDQKRLWLMGQRTITAQKGHGRLHLYGNYFWADWMPEIAGKRVIARFDIEDLHAGVHVFELTGEFMGFAPCQQAVGFYDLSSAKDDARKRAAFRRAHKKALELHKTMDAGALSRELDELPATTPAVLEQKVVRLPQGDARPRAAKAERVELQSVLQPETDASVLEFQRRVYEQQADAASEGESSLDTFRRALELERQIAAGEQLGRDELKWLEGYQTHPEYLANSRMFSQFGEAMFGD